jgi:hypothetical protein
VAFRSLRSTPIVNTVAVLSLALGIGANTAAFSVVDSLVLRSLPVLEPQRLFMLSADVSGTNRPQFSDSTLNQIRKRGHIFDGVLGDTSCCGKSIVAQAGTRQMVDAQGEQQNGDTCELRVVQK